MARSWLRRVRPRPRVVGQLWRFGTIGVCCAILDFATYHGLRALGMDTGILIDLARAISFVIGTTTAYLANKRFTFAATGGLKQLSSFMLLYGTVFFVAVGVNRWMLQVLPVTPWQSSLAWLISQAMASAINFVMLKLVVFRESDRQSVA
ncbi:GtrA family protein [Haloechinothrix sp. LS1_15]|uniref:GtrA family protein n=1 Tax=Haloechinothrix sp. LS1_15 TaxID=2652248 RepID=UPI002947D2F4|nr:GtrA family protein [Haloechinothrix sp. LS1_15]MDV6012380.1 GtrA family protein [Haloechinothrix sp. LS1_15]